MARNIRLDQIGDLFDEQVQTLVKRTTFLWKSELQTRQPPRYGTPVDTDVLRQAWDLNVSERYVGRVFNAEEYAPAVIYGEDMPPSWQGQWRTKREAVQGFPDLLGKEISVKYVPKLMRAITGGN